MKKITLLLAVLLVALNFAGCNSRSKEPNEHLVQIGEEALKIIKNVDDAKSAEKAIPKLSKLENESKDLLCQVEKEKSGEELKKLDNDLKNSVKFQELRKSYKNERTRFDKENYYRVDGFEKACNGIYFL